MQLVGGGGAARGLKRIDNRIDAVIHTDFSLEVPARLPTPEPQTLNPNT